MLKVLRGAIFRTGTNKNKFIILDKTYIYKFYFNLFGVRLYKIKLKSMLCNSIVHRNVLCYDNALDKLHVGSEIRLSSGRRYSILK